MQQEKALALLKSGKNVFLTGSAGTGKTFVLNQYIRFLKERKIIVAVTASTGIAATHMNGMTIHSWSGIGIKESVTQRDLANMKTKKYLKTHLEKVKVLIIDEISMLHLNQLNAVDQVLRYFQDPLLSFGGVQVVLCGDFFQLPPIGSPGETSKEKFAFMSQAWVNASMSVCYLTEQYRQNDNDLNLILNEIRRGCISNENYDKLLKSSDNKLKSDVEPTKLYTHNVDVDRINKEHLSELSGVSKKYVAETKGNKLLTETLKKSVLAGEELTFKVGAKVMFVKNDKDKRYVNGSLGTVIGFNDEGIPSVKLLDGRTIYAAREDWSIMDDTGKTLANYNQIPLRLAWAITIHKCQGMTLDSAEIDLSKTFEMGQGYVAISRLKKLESLNLKGLNKTALEVDSLAYKADLRFQELSQDADNAFTLEELDLLSKTFIRDSGGLINKKEITKQKNKLKAKSEGKQPTYEVTLMHLKQEVSLEKIAEIRGLTLGTISGHLIKIRKDNPSVDLSYYRPKASLIKKVKLAYDKEPKNAPISLTSVHRRLGGTISYDDLKLAVAFMDN
ncbi:MAG: AAA family ATPase [Flavobacteriaceae bacterium]|nr:AAA family ATPase [Flavobacteriaceae bacterium]